MSQLTQEHARYARWLTDHARRREQTLRWLGSGEDSELAFASHRAADVPRLPLPEGAHITSVAWSPGRRHAAVTVSRDHGDELWLTAPDGSGSRRLPDVAVQAGVSWSPDGRRFAAGRADQTGRVCATLLFDIGRLSDLTVVYLEPRSDYQVAVRRCADPRFAAIVASCWTGRDYFILDWDDPLRQPRPVPGDRPGRPGWLLADVHEGRLLSVLERDDHAVCRRYVGGGGEFGVPEHELVIPGCRAADRLTAHHDRLLVFGRDGVASAVWSVDLTESLVSKVTPPPGVPPWGFFEPHPGREAVCRYSSLNRPAIPYLVGARGGLTKLAGDDLPEAEDGTVRRITVPAIDGTDIPVTVCVPPRAVEPVPLLLLVYGVYGIPLPLTYAWTRRFLLAHRIGFAFAHIRGGGDLGRHWHTAATGGRKHCSVDDLIAVLDGLEAYGLASRARIAVRTFSAGALLLASALQRRPDLCRAVILDSPYFGGSSTFLPTDRLEFLGGSGPAALRGQLDPPSASYPRTLTLIGGRDTAVDNLETLAFLSRLRAADTSPGACHLVRFEPSRDHRGTLDRRSADEALADVYTFILNQIGPPPR